MELLEPLTRLTAKVKLLTDDALRSEYVSACQAWTGAEPISVLTRIACIEEARRRGLKLRQFIGREK
jgi:hypothetical protein